MRLFLPTDSSLLLHLFSHLLRQIKRRWLDEQRINLAFLLDFLVNLVLGVEDDGRILLLLAEFHCLFFRDRDLAF